MKLPNVEAALIPREKIVDYLLSSFHKDGKGKADFFKRFGFTVELWHILAEALVKQALENEVMKKENTPFGTRYVVEGNLETPSGRRAKVRAVWFIEFENTVPRLATAYPLRRGVEND